MTPIQQQRLIGAILLVCGISGIAYFLMSNASQTEETVTKPVPIVENHDFTSSIEEIPNGDLEIVTISEPEVLIDPHNLAVESRSKEDLAIEYKEEPKKDSAPLIASEAINENTPLWILQIASFSVQKNAQAIQEKIMALGYDAKIQASDHNSTTIYRVRIGPNNNKTSLEKISVVLNKNLGLKSQIIQKK